MVDDRVFDALNAVLARRGAVGGEVFERRRHLRDAARVRRSGDRADAFRVGVSQRNLDAFDSLAAVDDLHRKGLRFREPVRGRLAAPDESGAAQENRAKT